MNFFHRPKTPTNPARPPKQLELHHTSHRARPKLTARVSNEAAVRSVLDDARIKRKDGQPSTLYEDEAVKPFDYLAIEDRKLYLGSWKPLRMVETIHTQLMSDMRAELPVKFNGELCQIFEDYRRLLQEDTQTTAKEQAEGDAVEEMHKIHTYEKRQWRDDEADYLREIKRLETIIAYSNRGVEGVIKARRNSVIRKKKGITKAGGMETVEEGSIQKCAESPSKSSNGLHRDDHPSGELLEPRKQYQESNTRLLPRSVISLANLSDPTASLKPLDLISSSGLTLAASPTQDRCPDQDNINPPLRALEQEHDPNPGSDKRRVWRGHGSDAGLKTPSAISSGSTWSNFMPWPARKHQRKPCNSKAASSSIQGTTDFSLEQNGETAPVQFDAASTQDDLRCQRPTSFYHGDELDFERRTSLYRRQRSSSLSEIPPSEQTMISRTATDASGNHVRPMSMDMTRPEHLSSTKGKPISSSDDASPGTSSRYSSFSNILQSNEVSDTLSHESSKLLADSWKREDTGYLKKRIGASVLPTAPPRRGTVIKRGKAGPEGERRSRPAGAAAAAANAATALSNRPAKENTKFNALNTHGDKNIKRR